MRKFMVLFGIVLTLAIFQACSSKNNHLFIPHCQINEDILIEKWWHPEAGSNGTKTYFTTDGRLLIPDDPDIRKYTLEDCNILKVTNQSQQTLEVWIIKSLSNDRLEIGDEQQTFMTFVRNPVSG